MKMTTPSRLFSCCGKYIAVSSELDGVKIKCPSCGKQQRVTQSSPKITIMSK